MEASEALVTMLDRMLQSHTQIAAALIRLEERQQEHNLALAQAMAENTQLLAKGIEDNSRSLAQIMERMETRMAARDHALAQILERVVDTTSRSALATSSESLRFVIGRCQRIR
jgi:hypothetical protein